jgi:hypothetical protein
MSSTNPVDILSLQKISQHPCMQPALAARETIARRAEAIYPQIHQEKQQIALARLAQKDAPTGGSEGLISSSLARIQALERRLSDLQPEIDAANTVVDQAKVRALAEIVPVLKGLVADPLDTVIDLLGNIQVVERLLGYDPSYRDARMIAVGLHAYLKHVRAMVEVAK